MKNVKKKLNAELNFEKQRRKECEMKDMNFSVGKPVSDCDT